MRMVARTVGALSAVVVVGCLASGCACSLFTSEHKHYEYKPGTEERLKILEQKVQAVEQSAQTNRVVQ